MAVAAIQAMRSDDSIRLIGADMNRLAAGMYLVDRAYMIPLLEDQRFFQLLFDIIIEESVDIVIPALDPFLLPFSRRRHEIERLGARLMVSPTESILITRDKWLTYSLLRDHVPVPTSWIVRETVNVPFPVFIKPRYGSGSVDAFRVNSAEELDYRFGQIESPIVQELLAGDEYTIDCLADESGTLLVSIPRRRLEVKAGVCIKSQIIASDELNDMAAKISSLVRFSGPFFFQAKEDDEGVPRLTEINSRISGTMSLSSASGWNIHLNAVRLALGKPIRTAPIKYGSYVSRYWKDIYLDEIDVVK